MQLSFLSQEGKPGGKAPNIDLAIYPHPGKVVLLLMTLGKAGWRANYPPKTPSLFFFFFKNYYYLDRRGGK
jgi:hypothetical protein